MKITKLPTSLELRPSFLGMDIRFVGVVTLLATIVMGLFNNGLIAILFIALSVSLNIAVFSRFQENYLFFAFYRKKMIKKVGD